MRASGRPVRSVWRHQSSGTVNCSDDFHMGAATAQISRQSSLDLILIGMGMPF
jgi:hypothetical protein